MANSGHDERLEPARAGEDLEVHRTLLEENPPILRAAKRQPDLRRGRGGLDEEEQRVGILASAAVPRRVEGGATPRPCPARLLSGTAQCERNSNGSAGANFSETSPESSGFPASESLVGFAPGFRFSFSRSTQKAEGLYADSK